MMWDVDKGEAMNENSSIDWAVAHQTVQGDEELLRELVSTFLDELPSLRQTLGSALGAGDAKLVQRTAHTLKGALGHFGAHRAYEAAFQVESHGRNGQLTQAADALAALDQAMAELTPILLKYVGRSGHNQRE